MKIGVIGAGAWGTALAAVAAGAGHEVVLWARRDEQAAAINRDHVNTDYLPGMALPAAIRATAVATDLGGCDAVMLATPAQSMAATLAGFAEVLAPGTRAIITSKGIEQETGRLMSEVLAGTGLRLEPYVLSGPSFAADVVKGLPTAVTLGGESDAAAQELARELTTPSFRVYSSGDLIGVQVGGATKNVLAIACGIAEGRGLGQSARAALTTRGFAELIRFGRALGASPETLAGLSGLGDLILTCSSLQSRNFSLGAELGKGRTLDEIMAGRRTVAEGVHTARIITGLAERFGVEMPVCQSVAAILDGRSTPDEEIMRLMTRPQKHETA